MGRNNHYNRAPAESKQTLCSFVRSTRGIITKLKRAWQKQQYYLGEWHYHPNASPKPSALDLKTMVNLSKDEDLGCPEPILLVIGGSSSNWLQYIGVYVKEQEIELYEIIITNATIILFRSIFLDLMIKALKQTSIIVAQYMLKAIF